MDSNSVIKNFNIFKDSIFGFLSGFKSGERLTNRLLFFVRGLCDGRAIDFTRIGDIDGYATVEFGGKGGSC